MVPLLGVSLLWGLPGHSQPKRYDPDPQACQLEAIRTSYQANLLPWQDQPQVVQQRLRQLQAAMTLDTLQDCQAKGLLSSDQVRAMVLELRLPAPPGSTPTPPGSPSPARP